MKKMKATAWVLVFALLLGANPLAQGPARVKAATTQQEIKDKEKEKKDLKDKLNNQKNDLNGLKKEQKSLKNQLSELNEQMTEVRDRLEDLENQIHEKSDEIERTQEELAEAIATEEEQYDSMQIRVRKMYERNQLEYITSLLQAGSFGKLLNLASWFEKVESYDKDKLKEYQDHRALVEKIEARLREEKKQLDALYLEQEIEQSKIAGLISSISVSLADYADQIEEAEKKALEYEKKLKQSEEDLAALKKKLEEELKKSKEAEKGKWRNISDVTFSDGDRKLLASIIYCEAGNEPYAGQVAVGAVVINRLLSNKFPDTVVGVVYQKNQFSPASSGRLELALAYDQASASCYKAADEAMSGYSNVGTCVFFRTPVPGLSGIQIGHHIFY